MAPARKTTATKDTENTTPKALQPDPKADPNSPEERAKTELLGNVTEPADTTSDLSDEDKLKVAAAEANLPDLDEGSGKHNVQLSRTDSDRPFVTSNRFSVAQVEIRGREDVAISTVNHVGPAELVIRDYELDELIEVLTKLKRAPQPKEDSEA